jgi:trehalose 6-phosphate synthase/phosphatase
MNTNKRIFIVSNRLPLKLIEKDGKFAYKSSEGGLATGLGSIYKKNNNVWIGWPGSLVPAERQAEVIQRLEKDNLYPVFLDQDEIDNYYEGFSNETLWPLFHYFPSYTNYNPEHWESYKKVNEKFAEAILQFAGPEDIVWVHDYQLMLVPGLVRRRIPSISIGYFNHIPFPSYEIFRLLPWRSEILSGVLGADVVGFHTYDDVRHFLSAGMRIINTSTSANEITMDNRRIVVDAFPISIDFEKYNSLTQEPATKEQELKVKKKSGDNLVIISIDRLDYSKGIINRLQAFDLLLQRHPELAGKIQYIHVIVPSRDNVPKYQELKREMDRLIGDINGRYSMLDWQPISHFYRSLSINLLSAIYKSADIALVTPLRDGMNLVSKEYVASKPDCKGVLILSEMAGAARELSDAIFINPTDIWEFAEKIYEAINMTEAEKLHRISNLRKTVSKFDIHNWVKNFVQRLMDAKDSQQYMSTSFISNAIMKDIAGQYKDAKRRLIALDYDGTLVPYYNDVNSAYPNRELLNLLGTLADDPANMVVVTGGRDHDTLDRWIGHLRLGIVAEHGALYKSPDDDWHNPRNLDSEWKNEIYNVLDTYCRRTPGSFIEEKTYSLAWHYRRAEEGLGQLRAQELIADLKHMIADLGLHIIQGNKVLEIKNISVNKGNAVKRFLDKDDYDFVIAIGDDQTDEDTFKAMPDNAITIKVGTTLSIAKYYLKSIPDVLNLLLTFAAINQETELET